MKLWDYEHPYYMTEGCYFSNECVTEYSSWMEFLAELSDSDIDYNRVHRWDFNEKKDMINIYFILQRKAYTSSCHVKIKPEDHDQIKEYLKPHALLNRDLWKGVLEVEGE